MSTYLRRDDLEELTGYTQRSAVIRWLDVNGWPYAIGRVDGWPRVLREYHDSRMMGEKTSVPRKRVAEPEWTVT